VTKHFTVWTPCLVLFDRIWSCLIKFEGHQTFNQKLKTFLLFSCLDDVLFVWTAEYHVWDRHAYHACSAAWSIVLSVFDQTCFNRLATHFKIIMFGVTKQCLMASVRFTGTHFYTWMNRDCDSTVIAYEQDTMPRPGANSRKPRKLFVLVKPFLVHLRLKTEKCIRLKLLVWRELLFICKKKTAL